MVPGERSASKKTKFPAKFYRCKYSFWFRPTRNTSRPRRGNNVRPWRRVGSRERDLSLPPWITEFRTRDDKFRKFPRPFLLNDIAIFDRVLAGIRYFIFHVFEAFLFLLFLDGVPYRRIRIIFEIPIHKFTGSVIVFFRTEQNRNESFFSSQRIARWIIFEIFIYCQHHRVKSENIFDKLIKRVSVSSIRNEKLMVLDPRGEK